MPWLAPTGTPAVTPAIDIQAPSWLSSRASTSPGAAFDAGSERDRSLSACRFIPSVQALAPGAQRPSTAWSTARMPVENQSHSGVWSAARGSSTTEVGIMSGCS